MGISIKDLLTQEFFSDFIVVAGRKGLHKEVQGVAILDAPDAFKWSKGKELILSTGYVITKEPDCIRRAFKEGSLQKSSALMIKRERYLAKIPEEIVELFEEHEIPLISMPFEIPYMDVMKNINTIVMNRTIRRFQIQQNNAFQLANITYKDQKIKKILQAVEIEMNFPAFLYDVGEGEGYYSSSNFKKISDAFGLEEQDYWNPRQEHTRHTLCDYIRMSRIRLIDREHPDNPRVSWILIPISIGGQIQAYFVVMESRDFLDYYDEYSIRIAYLLLQSVYEQIVIARNVGNIGFENFVLLAMNVSETERERVLYQAGQQGLSMNTHYICVLFRQTNEELSARRERAKYVHAFQNSEISQNAKTAFLDENEGIILIEVPEKTVYGKERLKGLITDFCRRVREQCPDMDMEFAVLREGRQLGYLKQSIEKCKRILSMGRILFPQTYIWDYDMIGPFTWLEIPEEEMEILLKEYRSLLEDEKNVVLLRTLKIYLENNMNYSITAEKMYVHINTIRKRIEKVNELLSIDWEQYMSRLKAEIMLQFLDL